MEQKQLNFNAPLLSVRRLLSSSKATAQTTNDKPAKNGKNRLDRRSSLPVQKKTVEELTEVTKPAAVPFQWEKTPGRAKEGKNEQIRKPTTPPRLPPGRLSGVQNQISGVQKRHSGEFSADRKSDATRYTEHAALLESLANGIIDTDDSGVDEDDDVSSVAKSDSTVIPNSPRGGFVPDPKTRDFLMSRFLPAAKALVLEIPQYASRKQKSVSGELPAKPAKKFYSGELRPLRDQTRFSSIPNHKKHVESNKYFGESDDNDDEGFKDNVGKKTGKSWGSVFFPKLCVKNALFLMSPMPGLKSRESSPARKLRQSLPVMKSRPPVSPAGEVRRMARTAHSGPLPQTREKHIPDPVYRRSSQLVRKTRNLIESENKLTPSQPSESPNIIDSLMTDLSLESRPSRGGGRISPYRNEAPRSPFHDGARFLGLPKNLDQNYTSLVKTCDNFLAVSSQKNSKGVDRVGPVSEKTLYIDSDVKLHSDAKLDQDPHRMVQVKDVEVDDSKKESLESSLPPLFPKSPSESWLWNTLPSISFRNPFSPTMTRKQLQNSPKKVGAKWETIVKTSNVRHDHVRYSEELVPHLSPHSKT